MMPVMLLRLFALFACLAIAACSEKEPPAPNPGNPGNPGDGIPVSGSERLGWSQQASDAAALAQFQYAAYVDNARVTLNGVTCGTTATDAGFECSAPLPPLTPGAHTLELAAFVMDPSGVLESSRSGPLRVVMSGTRMSGSTFGSTTPITTAEGQTLSLERISDGLTDASDLAFAPDGAIYVAQRSGVVRVVRDGMLVREPALDVSREIVMPSGGLLAIAVDPKFDETGFLYALYAAGAPRGGLEFMLARFRGVADKFAERAILLDRVAASSDGASGALRIGADGKLYVALDSAADLLTAGSFGSYNGKVLRLNTDATTPGDQDGFTPIYSFDHPQPKALDWQPASDTMWVIDSVNPSGGRLSAVTAQVVTERRAAVRTAYTIPQGTGPSSAAFYRGQLIPIFRGNLFVAAEMGQYLMRMQFDSEAPTRIASVEHLLNGEIGSIRVVAEGRDGALYLASDTSLYRMRP
jgi:glucose/arabinose dehydrogenase